MRGYGRTKKIEAKLVGGGGVGLEEGEERKDRRGVLGRKRRGGGEGWN